MKKSKVMFMCNSLHGGGAERVLQTILNNIGNEFDITVYSVNEAYSLEEYPDKFEYKYIFKQKSKGRLGKFLVKVKNKIKLLIYKYCTPAMFHKLFIRGEYDVEVAFIEGYSTRIVSGANSMVKKLAWTHIDMLKNHWSSIAYKNYDEEKACYTKFDTIACVSEVVKHSMDSLFDLKDKTKVVYNPINEDYILESAKEEFRGIDKSESFRFITLGRLEEQKGYDRLIPIVAKLRSEGLDVELWILGEGSQWSNLKNLIKKYHVEDKVKLLGFKSNPFAYFKYCDVFVCSSRNEGYSTAVTEALILGMPVVSTLCSGTTELLGENSEYGIVTENSTDSLYQGMRKIIEQNCLEEYKIKSEVRGSSFRLKELMSAFENVILE